MSHKLRPLTYHNITTLQNIVTDVTINLPLGGVNFFFNQFTVGLVRSKNDLYDIFRCYGNGLFNEFCM
jgi:hypothetical protein